MKTLEYVKNHLNELEHDKLIDHRFTKRFLDFIPVDEWEHYGFWFTGEGCPPKPKEWTEKNILEQLKADVEFGIEKAENHRGISAGLMYDVCRSWCTILENELENTEYGRYGNKLFEAIDKKYGWDLTKGHFNEDFFEDW